MDRDTANASRLRINRIALIQQLDTEELIPKLLQAEILSSNEDVEYINLGTSRIDRARRLIDCLLDEEGKQIQRPTNWFLLFRGILLQNASVYSKLITILDNTIIRTPEISKMSSDQSIISSKNSEEITTIEFDPYSMNKFLIRGSFHKTIDNIPYYSQVYPKIHFLHL